jgi:DNA repair exonuclease SbcCD ATPase subunit
VNIAPISRGTNSFALRPNQNDAIKQLETQKEKLQEQIKSINESKQDEKTKQDRSKQIQQQIQQIEAQIQQQRNENRNTGEASQQQAASPKNEAVLTNSDGDVAKFSSLVQANTTYSRAKIIDNVKSDLHHKTGILNTEIKLDGGRGGATKTKQSEVAANEDQEKQLSEQAGEALQASHEQVSRHPDQEDRKRATDPTPPPAAQSELQKTNGKKADESLVPGDPA